MNTAEIFQNQGYLHVKDVVSGDVAKFMTEVLRLRAQTNPSSDEQCPNAKTVTHGELIFDTLLEKAWPVVEAVVGEELIPTYSYARLYGVGDKLEKHTDRESCEISMTIQLGRSHHYAWPIYMGGTRIDLGEGEGVIYKGCEVEHWRNECDPPNEAYYSGQVFLHYVRAKGQYAEWAGDKRYQVLPFMRNRNVLMESK